jgi:hypothetical protein
MLTNLAKRIWMKIILCGIAASILFGAWLMLVTVSVFFGH